MNKTTKNCSSKHLRKQSDTFTRTQNSFKHRGSERLKTLQSCDELPFCSKDLKNQFMVTKKAKLNSKGHSKSVFKNNYEDENMKTKVSNFEVLKKQAFLLENSEFLKNGKYDNRMDFEIALPLKQSHSKMIKIPERKKSQKVLAESNQNSANQYIVNNQFVSFKKISVLDKCRQNIKKLNRNRFKTVISKEPNKTQDEDIAFSHSFAAKKTVTEPGEKQLTEISSSFRFSTQSRPKTTFRKEHGSSVAKKFYQPNAHQTKKSRYHKSYSAFLDPNLKVKAMEMTSRNIQKQNEIVIVCL